MHERMFCIIVFVFCLSSCCTSGRIYNHGNGTFEVRENIGKLGDTQTQSAITNTELKNEIDRSLEEVGKLEQSIADGEGDIAEFKAILFRIRSRGKYKNSGMQNPN